MFLCYRWVIVVNKQAEIRLGLTYADQLQVSLKTRHDLFKRLLVNSMPVAERVEMNFVDTFCEQSGKLPIAQHIGQDLDDLSPLCPSQVYVAICEAIRFFEFPVSLAAHFLSLKERCSSVLCYLRSTLLVS